LAVFLIISTEDAKATAGNILYVGGSGPGNYTSIQSAIDDANYGDIIFVYSGIYYENVVINKKITLVGENKETTIIDANHREGYAAIITANGATMQEFTVRNSDYRGYNGIETYAGVRIYSYNNSILDCNINNNTIGILLEPSIARLISTNASIFNCNISNNDYGISLYFSANNSIFDCNIENNTAGISLYSSANDSIFNCTFLNDGIVIGEDITVRDRFKLSHFIHNIYNNTVNGKPLLYYKNAQNVELDGDAGQIILVNCSDFEIRNMNIFNVSGSAGIDIDFSDGIDISNCNMSNNYYGVMLYFSTNTSISDCNVINNHNGISLHFSTNNSIFNCTFLNDGIIVWGDITGDKLSYFIHNIYNNTVNGKPLLYYKNAQNVELDGNAGQIILVNCSDFEIRNMNIFNVSGSAGIDIVSGSNVNISNCNMYDNYIGIGLCFSTNISISNCNTSNNVIGILLYSSVNIFEFSTNNLTSTNNLVSNCSISNNTIGILFYFSNNNSIYNNNISNNEYGIYCRGSRDNLIYNNYFDNHLNSYNTDPFDIFDGDNIFNISKTLGKNIIGGNYLGGNYWSDYHGVDMDGDGLGDTMVPHHGDYLPLTTPNYAPIINVSYFHINTKVVDIFTFNASSSYDLDGEIVNYTWQFGDGSIGYGKVVTHTYSSTGIYHVVLTLVDNIGAKNSTTLDLHIITNDTTPPLISIEMPMPQHILIFRIFYKFPLPNPWVIGELPVVLCVSDESGVIDRVEFYIDGKLKYTNTSYPYYHIFREKSFGRLHTITVKAYDGIGNSATAEIKVRWFCF